MTKNKLTPVRVEEIFRDCLFRNDEDHSGAVVAEGIMMKVGFHPDRLESHRADVIDLLDQLPETFHEKTGGGWSFLQACQNRDGELWTGSQPTMDNLFILGMALGLVVCPLPRELWPVLPGEVPYYMVVAA